MIPAALNLLPKNLKSRINIVHQAVQKDVEVLQETYRKIGMNGFVVTPFINDMRAAIEKAHLILCRSGAGNCSEMIAMQRPAIMIPYPYATDNHQYENAKGLARQGACWLVEHKNFNVFYLGSLLKDLLQNPKKINLCALSIKGLSQKNSDKELVIDLS